MQNNQYNQKNQSQICLWLSCPWSRAQLHSPRVWLPSEVTSLKRVQCEMDKGESFHGGGPGHHDPIQATRLASSGSVLWTVCDLTGHDWSRSPAWGLGSPALGDFFVFYIIPRPPASLILSRSLSWSQNKLIKSRESLSLC